MKEGALHKMLNKLCGDWGGSEIIVWGFGRVGQRNITKLEKDFHIKYIIDNNTSLKAYHGIPIKKFLEVKGDIRCAKIVVATASFAYSQIKEELIRERFEEYKDFCRLEEFMPEWYWRYKKSVCLSQAYSSVTTKCTFKCKHCSALVPLFKEQYFYKMDDIVQDLDLLFNYVDYLSSYYIVGGEPFIHPDLAMILKGICEKYRDRIGCFQIITNGSIVPSGQLLEAIKVYDIEVRLSDYTEQIPYGEKYGQVKNVLLNNGIKVSVSKYDTWFDLGFSDGLLAIDGVNLAAHMRNCSVGCHQVNEKKLYYCGMLYYSEKSGLYKLREDDFLDLETMPGNKKNAQEKILNYALQGNDNGYVSLCAFCRGYGRDNDKMVKAAEQLA